MRVSRRMLLFSGVATIAAACTNALAGGIPYSVGVSGDGNHVSVERIHGSNNGYRVTVQSARGIGQATIAWWGTESPHPLDFCLQLNGLEHFSVMWEQTVVNVSVNATDQSVHQSVQADNDMERAIAPDSPYWLDVEAPIHGPTGYVLAAPVAFRDEGPRLWSIAWIDFYR